MNDEFAASSEPGVTPPAVIGSVAAPEAHVPVAGLVSLKFDLKAVSDAQPGDWTLELRFPGREQSPFRRHMPLTDGAAQCVLKLNSHLLRNGLNEVAARFVSDDGGVGWQTTIGLTVRNEGSLADKVRASLRSYGTPLVVYGPCDTGHYDYADEGVKPWFDRSDALDYITRMHDNRQISAAEVDSLTAFVTSGYLVVEDVVEDSLLDLIGRELEDAAARKIEGYEYGSSQRIHNLHLVYPGVRRLWSHPGIMRLLALIFESEPRPCQTLTYIFGSEQPAHQDTVHLTPFPAGYMCGVWVAIDDVQPNSGELEVYRGSHRLPRIYMKTVDCPKVANGDYSTLIRTVGAESQRLLEAGRFERIVSIGRSEALC